MKIAIIGAGAAGIMTAITAKRLNKSLQIDIFDANKSIGKKILASGNGRCNISNKNINKNNYIGEDTKFVDYALKQFDFFSFEEFCKSIGLLLDIKDNGKVYPLSNEAKSVTKLLEIELLNLDINLYLEHVVSFVEKIKDKFTIRTSIKDFKDYDKVVISSGLKAAPQLNASEVGLEIASNFGHSINSTYPSLVGLKTQNTYNGKLQGVKKECNVGLYINGNFQEEILGDVLFTAYGLSGFAILDISQFAVYNLVLNNEVSLKLNLFPNIDKNSLFDKIVNIFKNTPNKNVVDILTGIISNKISKIILQECKIKDDIKTNEINLKQIKTLSYFLNSWHFRIIDTQGFSHSEASGGGVRTCEINNKTFESNLCKNLYFIGEVLDIVGNRGGYNLHFAWASGFIAGKNLSVT